VGITILLWGNAPDIVLISALIDESSEAIPDYQFQANIVGWYKDRSRGPIIIAQKIQNPNTEVSFKGLSLELIDWGSLGVVYLGSDDDRIIRFSKMLNIPANEH
jgi:hypothetical protein